MEESAVNADGGNPVSGRALPGGENTDQRLLGSLGGMLGRNCFNDYHCPGQMKCCAVAIGNRATCQQPGLLSALG